MLNKQKGNMYGFINCTVNFAKGLCSFSCSYCYMKRWGNLKEIRLDEKEFKTDLGSGNFIFVGSSCDMFADVIPDEWISRILEYCGKFDNKYLFQSKNPRRFLDFLDKFPKEVVLTTTLESDIAYKDSRAPSIYNRVNAMMELPDMVKKMVTIEPIMKFNLNIFLDLILKVKPFQVNIGAVSGGHTLDEPTTDEVAELVRLLRGFGINVFLKKNLKRLYWEE